MPDNEIGWGQGAVNNDTGWGKAYSNNEIGFGAVYPNSPSGDTNLTGSSGVSRTGEFIFEIDTSLAEATDLTHMIGLNYSPQPDANGFPTFGTWNTGTIDIDWGDNTAVETVNYLNVHRNYSNTRFNIQHTYSTGGVYEIKMDFTNASQVETDGFQLLLTGYQDSASGMGNQYVETTKLPRLTKIKKFGNKVRFCKIGQMFNNMPNLTTLPDDTTFINNGYVDNKWHDPFLDGCNSLTSFKSSMLSMGLSPARFSTSGRNYNTWRNCWNISEIEFKDVNIKEGYTAWPDAPSTYVGRDVANGTKVTWENVNIDTIPLSGRGAYTFYVMGFAGNTNRLHKDSVFRNVSVTNYLDDEPLSITMIGNNTTYVADDNEDLFIDFTNWRMTDNSPLDVGRTAFANIPRTIDSSTGNYRTTGWEIDFTSTSQWVLTGSYQNMLNLSNKAPANGTIKITGTGNWDITGVTNWYTFLWYGTTTNTILDMDISGWEVWNTASMAYFINNAKIKTSQYDAALISWNNNVPASASSVNIRLGTSQYTAGGAAETARTNLINTHGWTISDGGSV